MSHQPFTAAALRGAVDLSSLKRPAQPAGPASGAGSTSADGAGLVIEGTDASIRDVIAASASHPVVMVLWSPRLQESADFVATFGSVARRYGGRFQLVAVDVDANPTMLQLAAQHGVTGTVTSGDGAAAATDEPEQEQPLPPLHQKAFDAIEAGDLDGAAAAYREALAQSPADTDAKLGLAQVGLLQRTQGVDLQTARAAAAAAPTDVDAQILVADLDLLGGHVEDAFMRLIDTVRVTADADRNTAREHLVELFEVIGVTDERVAKARKSLMSALF